MRVAAYDGQGGVDGVQHAVERTRLRFQAPPLLDQRLPVVEPRIVERALDLVEREPEFPADQDLLQAQQIGVGVETVAGLGAPGRDQQADGVVVVQRANRHARHPGDVGDPVVRGTVMVDTVRPHAACRSRAGPSCP